MAQVKAKEKEMKQEKEEERQVRCRFATLLGDLLQQLPCSQIFCSDESKQSRTSEQRRKRGRDTRRWPKRCTASEWRD